MSPLEQHGARAAAPGRRDPAQAALQSKHDPRIATVILIALGGCLVATAAVSLRGLIHALDYHQVVSAIHATSPYALLLAIAATLASYAALIGYDISGLHYAGARLRLPIASLASFCAYAIGNVIGFGPLTRGAVRYRFYSAAGLRPGQITRVVLFCTLSLVIGLCAATGISLMIEAAAGTAFFHLTSSELAGLGGTCVLLVAGFICLCAFRRRPIAILGHAVPLPSVKLSLLQLLLALVDVTFSAVALWAFLPALPIGFFAFLPIYAVAVALASASYLPGGLGVFEAAILLVLHRHASLNTVTAALLLYRAVYFLGPFAIATLLLAWAELRRGMRGRVLRPSQPFGRAIDNLMPAVLSAVCFLSGIMLLASGMTPGRRSVLELLALQVPLPLLEASHFLSSIAGLGLLFVARGLFHRLDAAWWVALMIAAVNLSLVTVRGGAFGEVLVLGLFLAVLAASRHLFHRHASLLAEAFTANWLLAAGAVAAAAGCLFFFAYEEVPYHNDLWWQFEFDAQAPRALRAGLAILLLLLVASLRFLFRAAPSPNRRPSPSDLDEAQDVLRRLGRPEANLALLGDKKLLFSPERDAFIMYSRRGRSWIALFDPVGPHEAWPELIWRFIELAAASDGRVCFYHLRPDNLAIYIDHGLRVAKLGEEALLPLDRFNLKGPRLANLRHAVSRGEREGLSVEIVPAGELAQLMPDLARVSAAWLLGNRIHEKAFSLGAFRPDYVARQTVAVVKKGNRIIAFATLLLTDARAEAMVDLMRQLPDAPRSTMDFLFVRLIEHLKNEGYETFSLGMAPLAGFARHPLASRWHHLGHLIYRHGEHFYNFRGLRAFKEKFDPVWEPRYFAGPGGIGSYLALADTAVLIGAGLRPAP